MNKRISQPSYYVFSDDIAWVKENLPLPKAFFIDWNKGTESWQDMMLMSRCRHHIICNSTFSWWGAWLNPRENKTVIMPERWFRHCETPDICPDKWIKVPINQPDSIQLVFFMWVSENISDFGISSIPVANRCFFLNMKRNTSYSPIIR